MATTLVSDAAMCEGRHCLRIKPHPVRRCCCCFFFFFVSGFAPTHTNSAPTRADSRRTGLIQTKSAKYQCVSAGKRKSAGKEKKKKLKPKIPVDWTGY